MITMSSFYHPQTRPALRRNLRAIMVTAFRKNGFVTWKMTVEMAVMNESVRTTNVMSTKISLVETATASPSGGDAMGIWTVPTPPMK